MDSELCLVDGNHSCRRCGAVSRERSKGSALHRIVDGLNADGVLAVQGRASWNPGTISALLRGAAEVGMILMPPPNGPS